MSNTQKAWIYLLTLALIWGSSFILMDLAMRENEKPLFSWQQVASLRMILAALSMTPFIYKYRKLFFEKEKWKWYALGGIFGNLIPAFLFPYSEQYIASSFTGVLNGLVPFFTLIIAVFIFKQNITKRQMLGLSIGFVGMVGLSLSNIQNGEKNSTLMAILAVVLATICYAVNVNLIKHKLKDANSIAIAVFGLVYACIPCFIYLIIADEVPSVAPQYHKAWLYMIILSVVGTAIALIIFNYLIKISSTVFASSVTYLIPVVALSWGVFFHEAISLWVLFWVPMILSGIYLVRRREKS